jgi:hypothetical protein
MTLMSSNQRHHCCITVSSLFDHCICKFVLCHQQMHNYTSHALQNNKIDQWNLKTLKMTSNALQKDTISSMTSQKLENNVIKLKSTASLFHHCHITAPSLSHHCLITVWSLFLSKDLVSPKTLPRHCKRIKYDQWHLKTLEIMLKSSNQRHHCCITVASLFHHCLITVWSLFLAVAPVSRNTLPRHCKRLKYDQWHLKTLTIIIKSSFQSNSMCTNSMCTDNGRPWSRSLDLHWRRMDDRQKVWRSIVAMWQWQ